MSVALVCCRRDPEERWHIQEVMECSIFKTGDDLIEQLQVCPLHTASVILPHTAAQTLHTASVIVPHTAAQARL